MLGSPDTTLEDIAEQLSILKARVDADQALKLQKAAGNNQYEMQMLVNHHTSRRDGGLSPEKFRRICDLIEEVHDSPLSPQHNIYFSLPSEPDSLGEEARLNRFASFGHTARRLRRPYDFRSVMGLGRPDDPDVFVDYLRTLLQKDDTIKRYVPEELESVPLREVPHERLASAISTLVDEYCQVAARSRPGLSPVVNLGPVVAPLLYRNAVQPLVRQALVTREGRGSLRFIGLVDLPQHVDMHVKGELYDAWTKLFDGFARKDYFSLWPAGSEGRMDKLSTLLNHAAPHLNLRVTLEMIFQTLRKIPGLHGRDASLITLLVHTATHYMTHRAMLRASSTGDHAFTTEDLYALLGEDESIRTLLRLPTPENALPPSGIDDPELFFTSAQKVYMKLLGAYWDDTVRDWMHKTTAQKKRLRDAIQAKIDERLRFDENLRDTKTLDKIKKKKTENKDPIHSFSYLSL